MARNHGSLGGLAIVFMLGCSLDGSHLEGDTPLPLSVTPAGAGVSFGFVSGESERPMPLQAGAPNVVTTFPEIPGAFNFGPTVIGTIQQVRWTVTNIGDETTGPLNLTASAVPEFSASVVSCPPLASLESCDITITYLPQELESHSSTFSVVGFPGSAYVFSGSGRPPFSAENP